MPGVAGRSGRRPKPTAQKALAGNPGKRALNKGEPDFSHVTNIDPPEWLSENARRVWQMIVPQLCAAQVLALTDLHNVEAFCSAYGNWRLAQESIDQYGVVVSSAQGSPIKNPACTVANESMRQMVTFGSMLGLDPASRSKIIGNNKPEPTNPFADLMNS